MKAAKVKPGPRLPRPPVKRQSPSWSEARYDEYSRLNPKKYSSEKDSSTAPEALVQAWIEALEGRFSAWSALERRKRDRNVDVCTITQSLKLPSALVVPWGNQRAPDGLKDRLFRPEHMATRDHPGFSAWFNMDASDDVLRENFELFLRQSRKHWPFVAKVRGLGAANPKITKDNFRKWYDWKIIQLFDVDYHFAANGEKGPTPEELSNWVYLKEVDAKKVSDARAMLRETMSDYLPSLRHMRRSKPIYHLDAIFGEPELQLSAGECEEQPKHVGHDRSTCNEVDIDRLVADVLANGDSSGSAPACSEQQIDQSLRTTDRTGRSRPIELTDINLRGLLCVTTPD